MAAPTTNACLSSPPPLSLPPPVLGPQHRLNALRAELAQASHRLGPHDPLVLSGQTTLDQAQQLLNGCLMSNHIGREALEVEADRLMKTCRAQLEAERGSTGSENGEGTQTLPTREEEGTTEQKNSSPFNPVPRSRTWPTTSNPTSSRTPSSYSSSSPAQAHLTSLRADLSRFSARFGAQDSLVIAGRAILSQAQRLLLHASCSSTRSSQRELQLLEVGAEHLLNALSARLASRPFSDSFLYTLALDLAQLAQEAFNATGEVHPALTVSASQIAYISGLAMRDEISGEWAREEFNVAAAREVRDIVGELNKEERGMSAGEKMRLEECLESETEQLLHSLVRDE